VFRADIRVCNERIEHEQRLADAAPSQEAAMVHLQMVMLYKSQLTMLNRRQGTHDLNTRSCSNNPITHATRPAMPSAVSFI
jgi:hypothetical protein